MPSASPGPQLGGGSGNSNSSRQTTVGLFVLKMMYQPYGAAITAGKRSVSKRIRCPSESAPKTPNCADVTSSGPPLRARAAAIFGETGDVLLSGCVAQPNNPVITAAKRTSERMGMIATSLIVQCRQSAEHSIGKRGRDWFR